MISIEEVQISCQKENLKTTPSIFISCRFLNVNVAVFPIAVWYLGFFLRFSETNDSKFEFWMNPKKFWSGNETHC